MSVFLVCTPIYLIVICKLIFSKHQAVRSGYKLTIAKIYVASLLWAVMYPYFDAVNFKLIALFIRLPTLFLVILQIYFSIQSKYIRNNEYQYIIILGCRINEDSTLSINLQNRLDCALFQYRSQKEKPILIVSGGAIHNIYYEAREMKNYLIKSGVNENSIVEELESKNTYENLYNSMLILNGNITKVCIVSSNYHTLRIILYLYILKVKNVTVIGSKVNITYFLGSMINEWIMIIIITLKSLSNKEL